MKNWFLAALMVFGLLAVGLYASPPDPGGMVVSSTFATNTDFLDGGVIERATVQSATPWYVTVPMLGFAAVLGTALIALLFVVSVTPYVSSATRANTGNTSRPPERYDKAPNAVEISMKSESRQSFKRTKSPVLKRQSP